MPLSEEEKRERNAQRSKEYYRNNKDKCKKSMAEYYQKHKEHIKQKTSEYSKNNREKVNQKRRERREKDRSKDKIYNGRWKQKNKESVRCMRRNRVAAQKGADGSHTKSDILLLFQSQAGLCSTCKTDLLVAKYHVDHIVPISKGGSNWPSNLQLLCPSCNLRKSNKDNEEFLKIFTSRSNKEV